MSKTAIRAAFLACAALLATAPQADEAGDFDYYVLSLSWSPNWCEAEGNARNSPQCDAEADFGWVVHGLWPQYEKGWPQDCFSTFQPPSRGQTNDMADIMGTSGLAWYQWNKHGACSGLSPSDYYALVREAHATVEIPQVFRRIDEPVKIAASVIEDAFMAENPELDPDEITITCKNRAIQEARICLTKDLEFRECGEDVRYDCTQTDAAFAPIP